MRNGLWKPAGFAQALLDVGMMPEALAVKLQDLGWNTTIHTVLDWRSDRSGGPKHLVQVYVIADELACPVEDLIETKAPPRQRKKKARKKKAVRRKR